MRTVPSRGESGGELRIVMSSCNLYLTGDKGLRGLDMALPESARSGGAAVIVSLIAAGLRGGSDLLSMSLSPIRDKRELCRDGDRSASGVDMARKINDNRQVLLSGHTHESSQQQ